MTPFGQAVRKLRAERNISQKQMAADLGVSAAYLSALEHGNRSEPSWQMVQRIIGYFNIIWDEAEELQALALLSKPQISISTRNLDSRAIILANRLAANFERLTNDDIEHLESVLDQVEKR